MARKRSGKGLEEDDKPKDVVILSDDDDDDANADLSMAILAKASRKHTATVTDGDRQSTPILVHSSPSPPPAETTVLSFTSNVVHKPAARQCLIEKKQKRKFKKKQKKESETEFEENLTLNVKETTLIKVIGDNEDDNLELRQLLRGPRYFDPQDTPCFRCGNTGHFAGNCTEEARKKACFVCGSLDHEVKDCPQSCCLICQSSGHFSKACPNKGTHFSRLREKGNFCLRCGIIGHEMSSCDREYEPEDLQRIQCYVCRKYGHLCCVDVALTSERQDTCYNCGDVGHTGVGCAKTRGNLEGDRMSESVCYRCGETGHFARGCRKRDEDDPWDDFETPGRGAGLPSDGFQGFRSVPAVVGARKFMRNSLFYKGPVNASPVRWPERWSMETDEHWKVNGWKHKHHKAKGHKHMVNDGEYKAPSTDRAEHTFSKKGKHYKSYGQVESRKSYSYGKHFWRK